MKRIGADDPNVAAEAAEDFRQRRIDRWLQMLLDVPPPDEPKEKDDVQQEEH